MTNQKIADHFDAPGNLFSHGQTYAMHPLGCAAALAAIQEYEDKKIVENAAKMGKHLERRLNELKEGHKSVGDIRGKGLFWGVEIVKNKKTKKPFVTRDGKFLPNTLKKVSAELMNKGMYLVNIINTFIVAPPLIVNKEEIDIGVQKLDEALKIADNETK
jgi:taurine--2-oxoglutarate transaminase